MTEETSVNGPAALDGAKRITAVGDALDAKWKGIKSRIEGLNAAAPWGTDEPGDKFSEHYLKGNSGPAKNVLDATDKMVQRMYDLGPQIYDGVKGTMDLDELIGKWFGKQ
jgi:hypothetical protein